MTCSYYKACQCVLWKYDVKGFTSPAQRIVDSAVYASLSIDWWTDGNAEEFGYTLVIIMGAGRHDCAPAEKFPKGPKPPAPKKVDFFWRAKGAN